MRFPPAFLDELHSRLRISEIVGRRVRLKSKGNGESTGLCPFHNEKTPSFTVSDRKGFYHCFGCGVHGDAIKFVMDTQGRSFAEAVAELAPQAGMVMPKPDKEEEARYARMSTLYDVTEAATSWFQEQLKTTGGAAARDYLNKRGITEATIKTFRLGFAPDAWEALKAAMLARGITEQQLMEAGLVIGKESRAEHEDSMSESALSASDASRPIAQASKPERGAAKTYDRFRGRLIFPIMDGKGRVIAFGGRILGDGEPKYLNSPETELFHKGQVLYAFHLARERAFQKSAVVAVEGYMDAIALHQAGITNAVAPLGTALTEQHLKLLWKVAPEPVICLDGDKAGQRAMRRAAEAALPHLEPSLSLKFAVVTGAKDPDEVIKNHGTAAMRDILVNATPLADALWGMTLETHPMSTPEQKAAFEAELMRHVGTIRNSSVQQYYRDYYKDKLWQMRRSTPTFKSNTFKKGPFKPGMKQQQQAAPASSALKHSAASLSASPRARYETHLVAAVLHHPSLLEDASIEESFAHLEFSSAPLEAIRNAVMETSGNIALLENHEAAPHIKKLLTDRYLDSFTRPDTPVERVISGWNYMLAAYHLLKMEEEYAVSAGTLTDSAPGQVNALRQQVEMQKKLVEKEKLAYEAALDD